jgi:AcrR family transcriptional regulator
MASKTTTRPLQRRPKHNPQDSEQEILRAAEQLIRERPLREITVATIMSRTGLKRPAFWTHFRDLNEVIIRIAERIGQELVGAGEQWLDGSSASEQDLIGGLERATRVYAEHGAVLRALADAVPSNAQAEQAYVGIVERLATAVAARIETEQAAGSIPGHLDPAETGWALIWLNERYLYHAMARQPRPDVDAMVRTLSQIWLATLYGKAPETTGDRATSRLGPEPSGGISLGGS